MNYELFASTQHPSASNIGLYLIDIDGTMITSKSGRRWAADAEDWTWIGDVPATLRRLAEEGWTVALISNQSDWKVSAAPAAKIASILTALEAVNGWKPWTLVATATRKEKDTVYRKPARGLYDVLLTAFPKESRKPARVRMCGDAVGPTDPFPPYRWSDSDAAFAAAIGAEFVRPCELFEPCEPPRAHPGGQELVLLMGNPGSGKSTTGRLLAAAGYVHIEQDVVGTKAAVKKAVLAALATGASVVIDATHGSAVNREPYLTLASPVRILWHIRDGRPFNALREKPVPEVAYAVYSKHFAVPEIAEIVY